MIKISFLQDLTKPEPLLASVRPVKTKKSALDICSDAGCAFLQFAGKTGMILSKEFHQT